MTKNTSAIKKLLEKRGFEVESDEDLLKVRKDGLVNPADVRARVSEALSEDGWQGYYLKEVYAYMGSKKPWRTDEEGYVEIEPWEEFAKVEQQKQVAKLNKMTFTESTKVTPLST